MRPGRSSNEEMPGGCERAAAPQQQPGPFDGLVVLDDGTSLFGQVSRSVVYIGARLPAARVRSEREALAALAGVVSAGRMTRRTS
jgi:hypothetical protein